MIALFAFLDTFVLTGLFIPASLVLVAGGYLCAEGQLPVAPLLWWTFVAALAGNELTFWLGRWSGRWLIPRLGKHVPRIKAVMELAGPSLLLYYHFANSLRAALPALYGSLRYDRRRWLVFNTGGLAIWVVALWAVGYLAHEAIATRASFWQRLPSLLSVCALVIAILRIYLSLQRAWRAVAVPAAGMEDTPGKDG